MFKTADIQQYIDVKYNDKTKEEKIWLGSKYYELWNKDRSKELSQNNFTKF